MTHLNLAKLMKLTDADVCQSLTLCPLLQHLNLCDNQQLTNVILPAITQCPRLQSLNVSACTGMTGAALCDVLTRLHHLDCLAINHWTHLTAKELQSIFSSVTLRVGEFSWCIEMSDACLKELAHKSHATLLTLSLDKCSRLTDAGMLALGHCHQL